MKKLLTASIISLLPFVSVAQESNQEFYFQTQHACGSIQTALENTTSYGEIILFSGTGIYYTQNGEPLASETFFFVNQDTGTWALISMWPDGSACLVTVGFDFRPFVGAR